MHDSSIFFVHNARVPATATSVGHMCGGDQSLPWAGLFARETVTPSRDKFSDLLVWRRGGITARGPSMTAML